MLTLLLLARAITADAAICALCTQRSGNVRTCTCGGSSSMRVRGQHRARQPSGAGHGLSEHEAHPLTLPLCVAHEGIAALSDARSTRAHARGARRNHQCQNSSSSARGPQSDHHPHGGSYATASSTAAHNTPPPPPHLTPHWLQRGAAARLLRALWCRAGARVSLHALRTDFSPYAQRWHTARG